MANKPRKRPTPAAPVQINAKVTDITPSHNTAKLLATIKDYTVLGLAVGSFGTLWTFSTSILSSGPLPIPSRAEVQAVAKTVQEIHESEDKTHRELTSQLKGLSDLTQAQIADSRTSRLRSLRPLIEQAKINLAKEPSTANQDILDALQSQWTAIQDEIMKAAQQK